MTQRLSRRARAREIYGELAAKETARSPTTPPTPDPSPPLAPLAGGGEKQATRIETALTQHVRKLYETSAVPVREIATLAGVTERTIYKYARLHNWKPRYRWAADGARRRGAAWRAPPSFAPAKGAGGRFVRRADKDAPFATGLKATDPAGAQRAAAACRRAQARSRLAQAQTDADFRLEEQLHAFAMLNQAAGELRRYRQGLVAAEYRRILAAHGRRQAYSRTKKQWLMQGVRQNLAKRTDDPVERLLHRGVEVALAYVERLRAEPAGAAAAPARRG